MYYVKKLKEWVLPALVCSPIIGGIIGFGISIEDSKHRQNLDSHYSLPPIARFYDYNKNGALERNEFEDFLKNNGLEGRIPNSTSSH